MKKINAYEYQDLSPDIQKNIKEKEIECLVEIEMEELNNMLNEKTITEKEYYDELGCDKNYAEATAWFVPSCFYHKNKKRINNLHAVQ